jgi:GNAT superfamily N-acetyltransferase
MNAKDRAVVIREATEEDLPQILALYAQPGVDDGRVLSLGEARRIRARMGQYPDYRLYAAVLDERVVGTFALLIMDNLAHLGAPSAILEDVMVHPDSQGRGIGRAMVRYAMARSREAGCYKLLLSSNLKRERAHGFYEKLGFRKHGFSFAVDFPVGASKGGRSG